MWVLFFFFFIWLSSSAYKCTVQYIKFKVLCSKELILPERGVTISFSSWEVISKQRNALPDEFLCLPWSYGTNWIAYANHVIYGWGFGPYCTTWSLEGPAGDSGQSCRWPTISLWLNTNKNSRLKARVISLAGNKPCLLLQIIAERSEHCLHDCTRSFHALKAHVWDFPGPCSRRLLPFGRF